MLELNRNAEVSIHAQAADMEFAIERIAENNWQFEIEAASDLTIASEQTGNPVERIKHVYMLTDAQASATLALFIGELTDEELNL
jgi:hypothetical protein